MERIVAATSLAIELLGESALRTSAADLGRRARDVVLAAHGAEDVEAQRDKLLLSVEDLGLALADSARRLAAVAVVREAAAGLEGAVGAKLSALRDDAAGLARSCHEYLEAWKQMEEARRRNAEMELRRAASWWAYLRRIVRRHRAEGGERERLLDSGDQAIVAIDFLTHEAEKPVHLVKMARDFVSSAGKISVAHGELAMALAALQHGLQHGNGESMLNLVTDLGKAATDLNGVLGGAISDLRRPFAELVRACQDHEKGAEAMAAVQRAATEQGQGNAVWWRYWGLRRRSERVLEGVVVQNETRAAARGIGEGDDRRSPMQGYALFGCMSLLLALGDGVKETRKVFSDSDKLWILAVVSSWYTLVSLGVPSSSYGRNAFELCYAFVTSRVGMLGINVMTILFIYWFLVINNGWALFGLLSVAVVLHMFLFLPVFWRRDW